MQKYSYLLDSNMLGYLVQIKSGILCPQGQSIQNRLDEIRSENVFICCITVGEIEYGLKIAPYLDSTKQQLAKDMISAFPCLDVNANIAGEQYASLRAKLFEACAPKKKRNRKSDKKRIEEWIDPATSKELQVNENDLWISAVAMAYNMVLVTHDEINAIKRVAGEDLTVVDWTK